MKTVICLTLLVFLISTPSIAGSEYDKTIKTIGNNTNYSYVTFVENMATDCGWGHVYFSLDTEYGKRMYAAVLTAKATQKKISRIVFDQHANGNCHATQLEFE